ncbi:MAG: SDR family oxidoreductase [Pseudoalteromonas distincta]|uniref:SDR family oxidoreductase n=1 Tax=Pseudoalteromonas distincta TaxID=77608 RepID=UPI003F98159C
MKEVTVLIGAGAIGVACARRVSSDRHILVADLHFENAQRVSELFKDAGFSATAMQVDVSDRQSVKALKDKAQEIGVVMRLIHAAGVSPSQASPKSILNVDLYGTAVVLELFGEIIAPGGTAIVIASQSGHRLPALTAEQDKLLAITPVEELLDLAFLQADQVLDSLHAYQLSKRGNALRVMAESVRYGKKQARVNCISPGIIITPLARDELNGPRGDGYRAMIEAGAVKRAGTADEVANVAQLLMEQAGAFITGSDFLMDGGVTAAYFYGDLAK